MTEEEKGKVEEDGTAKETIEEQPDDSPSDAGPQAGSARGAASEPDGSEGPSDEAEPQDESTGEAESEPEEAEEPPAKAERGDESSEKATAEPETSEVPPAKVEPDAAAKDQDTEEAAEPEGPEETAGEEASRTKPEPPEPTGPFEPETETQSTNVNIGVAQVGPPTPRKETRDDFRGGRGRRGPRRRQAMEVDVASWQPKTRLGKLVQEGKITTLSQALDSGLPLRESTIVNIFLPDLEDDVLDINMVQRMTDSGRRVKFSITTVVGNRDGFIGLGRAKGKEVGPTIRKAIENAKLNIIEVKRGCGSWECGCGKPHSLPFAISGKSGSVEIELKPAPRGTGLSTGDIPSRILSLAGYEDVQSFAKGQTRTTVNFAKSVFDAILKMEKTRVNKGLAEELHIVVGPVGGV